MHLDSVFASSLWGIYIMTKFCPVAGTQSCHKFTPSLEHCNVTNLAHRWYTVMSQIWPTTCT